MLKRIRRNARHLLKVARNAVLSLRHLPGWLVRTARDPAGRDRVLAAGVFSAIFAVGMASADYVITGGPDWNPGAFDLPRQEYVELTAAPAIPADYEPPPAPVIDDEPAQFYSASVSADDLLGGPRMLQLASYAAPTLSQGGALPAPRAPGSEGASERQSKPVFIAS